MVYERNKGKLISNVRIKRITAAQEFINVDEDDDDEELDDDEDLDAGSEVQLNAMLGDLLDVNTELPPSTDLGPGDQIHSNISTQAERETQSSSNRTNTDTQTPQQANTTAQKKTGKGIDDDGKMLIEYRTDLIDELCKKGLSYPTEETMYMAGVLFDVVDRIINDKKAMHYLNESACASRVALHAIKHMMQKNDSNSNYP
ncbi:hypothetical protein SARC_07409 [Sphaeroforma arctica JP610]|uniref:Uncharacterized protein n=1 Tax=Sphaeroforma arctica JP610 TaxID=667725 RepID=A0A0L0FUK4_9EUKA|nr:hypothetical protein SARC_07409 [Sphaeroforma arctica JP610]KNC80231.1 hypothetical protein SARC_07409 [Sphaeroforma arctica JP610]|eukprot:XP_014154133.1 hypothetical protein SARC_07409 [Sphaeroforma arctica JP610]